VGVVGLGWCHIQLACFGASTTPLDVHDAILLICLALATQECGLTSRGRTWSESNELFVADLQSWVHVVKHHACLVYEAELDWIEDLCSIVFSTWQLRVFDDGIPGTSETCATALTRMLGAARHFIRLTLAALDIKPDKQSWRAADVSSEPDEQAPQTHFLSERVQPGKDPPDLEHGIVAFVAVATTAVSALGFILGLVLCMVSSKGTISLKPGVGGR